LVTRIPMKYSKEVLPIINGPVGVSTLCTT
jgi:hypothetical protein